MKTKILIHLIPTPVNVSNKTSENLVLLLLRDYKITEHKQLSIEWRSVVTFLCLYFVLFFSAPSLKSSENVVSRPQIYCHLRREATFSELLRLLFHPGIFHTIFTLSIVETRVLTMSFNNPVLTDALRLISNCCLTLQI